MFLTVLKYTNIKRTIVSIFSVYNSVTSSTALCVRHQGDSEHPVACVRHQGDLAHPEEVPRGRRREGGPASG